MHKRSIKFLSVIFIAIIIVAMNASIALGLLAQSEPVVKINGQAITLDQFEEQVRVNRYLIEAELNRMTDPAVRSRFIFSYKKQILDRMIDDELLIQEGEKAGYKVTDGLVETRLKAFLESLEGEYLDDYPNIFPVTGTTVETFKKGHARHIKAESMRRFLYIPSELSTEKFMNEERDRRRDEADIEIFLTRYSDKAQEFFRQVFPQASYFIKRDTKPEHYIAYYEDPQTEKRTALGFCFETAKTMPDLYGYSSRINILVGIDLRTRINQIKVLDENESGYLARRTLNSKKFVNQFKGKRLQDLFIPGQDLDAVSGATVSLTSAASSIRESGRLISSKFYQVKFKTVKPPLVADKDIWRIVAILLLMAAALAGALLKLNRFRYVVEAFALVAIGFLSKDYFSITHVTSLVTRMIPDIAGFVPWWLILVLTLVLTLGFGRVYCGWLCPFGTIQEILSFAKPLQKRIPLKIERWLKKLKYLILLAVVVSVLGGNHSLLELVEPFSTMFNLSGTKLMYAILAASLLPGLFMYRFYCRFFCPAGAVMALLSLISLNRVSRREACVSCRSCEKICRFEAIERNKIDKSECIRCADCQRPFMKGECPDMTKDLS